MTTAFKLFDLQRPPIPEQTCPIVDRVSAMADASMGDLERIAEELRNHEDEEHAAEVDEIIENLRKYRLLLEDLRTANEQLRVSGVYWRNAARDLARKKEPA
jgi:DNA-binding protein H-NS